MSELPKNILKMMGVLFAVLVLGFTGFQTWSLLYAVSGNAVTAVIGLALFEGGMLYWWFAFQKEAEGIPQMGLSLLMAVFGLFLVGGATALHLGAVSGEVLGENTPARLVTIAAVVNLIGKFLFPLVSPAVFENTWTRALEGKISMAAYRDADSKVDDLAVNLGDQIGAELTRKLQVKMLTHYGLAHEAEKGAVIVEGQLQPEVQPQKRGITFFGKKPVAVAMAASTNPAAASLEPSSLSPGAAKWYYMATSNQVDGVGGVEWTRSVEEDGLDPDQIYTEIRKYERSGGQPIPNPYPEIKQAGGVNFQNGRNGQGQ